MTEDQDQRHYLHWSRVYPASLQWENDGVVNYRAWADSVAGLAAIHQHRRCVYPHLCPGDGHNVLLTTAYLC